MLKGSEIMEWMEGACADPETSSEAKAMVNRAGVTNLYMGGWVAGIWCHGIPAAPTSTKLRPVTLLKRRALNIQMEKYPCPMDIEPGVAVVELPNLS